MMRPGAGPTLRAMSRRPLAAVLVCAEVALSIVVVVHVATLQRRWYAAAQADTRLEPETLFVVDADGDDADAQLRSVAGVTAVSRVAQAPHTLSALPLALRARQTRRTAHGWVVAGTPEVSSVLGLRLVDDDLADARSSDADPVLLSASLARELFGRAHAIGQLLDGPIGARPLRVTGVFRDVLVTSAWSPHAGNAMILVGQPAPRRAPWLVRVSPMAATTFPFAARRALAANRYVSIESMSERLARSYANVRGTFLITVALVALLAVAGTLGSGMMVSLFITARTREIGLRRALGARRGQVVAQLVGESLLLAGVGCIGGVALSFAVAPLAGPGPTSLDPIIVGAAVALLLSLTAVSAWIPARHAARISPAAAAGRSP